MKAVLLCIYILLTTFTLQAQSTDETIIRSLLDEQTKAWNRGDLEGFMAGYWKNDSLMFIGSSGVTYGYSKTLANYKRGYPTRERMGRLDFDIVRVDRLSPDLYFVIGKWTLTRTVGNLTGHYTLVLRKIEGEWKIVSDHSDCEKCGC